MKKRQYIHVKIEGAKKLYAKMIDAVKVATGYSVTAEEQYALAFKRNWVGSLRKMHPHFVLKIEKNSEETYTPTSLTFSDKQSYGERKNDLNRMSIKKADVMFVEAIKTAYPSLDGYISPPLPSLWHRVYIFHSELCFFEPYMCIERMSKNKHDMCVDTNTTNTNVGLLGRGLQQKMISKSFEEEEEETVHGSMQYPYIFFIKSYTK